MHPAIMPGARTTSRAHRRSAAALVGLFMLIPTLAPAQEVPGPATAEWAQTYDVDARQSPSRDPSPLLSAGTRAATEAAVRRYRQIVAAGGWPTVPTGRALRVGAVGDDVSALRRRLAASGDLGSDFAESPTYDDLAAAAVRRFQARHGIIPTGEATGETLAALDVPAETRLHQLELNLVRLGAFSSDLGRRFVTANLPAAAVETVEDGVVHSRHIAGVGKVDRPSPVMQTKALNINFNPFWTVPASIVRKDMIPRMRADPNYLAASRIRVFDGSGREVPPGAVDWSGSDAVHYRFRQDPGPDNALGLVRINIDNPYGVYMHDTPAKGDFGDDYRFVSSGCIHVQGVRDYVAWLLEGTPGWDRDRVDQAIRSGQRVDVELAEPVPVYWVYVTAWATPDGTVQFRDDIYGRDGLVRPGRLAAAATPGAGRADLDGMRPD